MNTVIATNDIINKFLDFLKYNEAYIAFMEESGFDDAGAIARYVTNSRNLGISDTEFINEAFTWDETENGTDFWVKLHEDWTVVIQTINEKLFKNLKSIW